MSWAELKEGEFTTKGCKVKLSGESSNETLFDDLLLVGGALGWAELKGGEFTTQRC